MQKKVLERKFWSENTKEKFGCHIAYRCTIWVFATRE